MAAMRPLSQSTQPQATLSGALLLALCSAGVAWRMVIGTLELRASQESSMLLGVPTWYATLLMTPSFALLALTALYSAWVKWQERTP